MPPGPPDVQYCKNWSGTGTGLKNEIQKLAKIERQKKKSPSGSLKKYSSRLHKKSKNRLALWQNINKCG